ncbi:ribosomal protein S18-alanine N-acetyltransferase [Bifidobacterium crudilactis]|jgi:ribosomal-protein-alanine N-acetyltransferase|uniref:ribosomal protein S18-alanine N-acetyltransferase n=1 Tax=Bifidobacterium crudilactis TaxID=327277 RepID=UPI002F35E452|nr:ribosomal protein S18-alanine N-acetyltransferase [Bifidobacterium crudilactis]
MIRALSEKDIASIATLEHELFGAGAWSQALVRQEINAPARTYAVDVDDDGTLRAYAGYWYDGDDAELMTIGVGRQHQQQGLATSLLRYLLKEAALQGAHRMLLEVRVDNTAALALYDTFGFERIGLRKRYYQPEGIDAYTMALDIDRWSALSQAGPVQPQEGQPSDMQAKRQNDSMDTGLEGNR